MIKRHFKAAAVSALVLAALASALPAHAQRIEYTPPGVAELPETVLSQDERAFYASAFAALDRQDWDTVTRALGERPSGTLHGMLAAEYYLHPNSPRIELPSIEAWLVRYRDLPQAEQMIRLGEKRGLAFAPQLPSRNSVTRQSAISKRTRPRGTSDGTMPGEIASAIDSAVSNDDPDGARMLLDGIEASLSREARTEWRQKVAWSYYIENRDTAALAMAQTVAGGSGPWVAEGAWVEGLAAWRLGDCRTAADAFERSAARAENIESRVAAHYWASRSHTRCRNPERAEAMLRQAAAADETLYGMLAREQLGIPQPDRFTVDKFSRADWRELQSQPNVRHAVALAELGRMDLAGEAIRHQALIGGADQFPALARLSRSLGLTDTQKWLGYNVPRGASPQPALRYPQAAYRPYGGWQVDPALAFAHALQESDFRESVVSSANAIGLMQIRPIAAREYASSINLNANTADLKDPATNLAFGQRALQALAVNGATRGHLPKVMAAYNAGLTPVARWNGEVRDQNDPLLYMESIPYWETRGYVAIVMRNYWIYLRQRDGEAPSRVALAQNKWPEFPSAN